jgi:hypothetical protein
MADNRDKEYEKTPTAGKGGSPASSTPNEEGRESGGEEGADSSRAPKEGKERAGGKGGGLH